MFKKYLFILNLLLFQKLLFAQNLNEIKFTVEKATDWTSLFQRTHGWYGGDGIYSIPLNGIEHHPSAGETLFIFSDSMIGEIEDGKIKPGSKMIHNAIAILEDEKPNPTQLKFHWPIDAKGSAESVFVLDTSKRDSSEYYWLGDGFVNQEKENALYIFGYRVKQIGSGTFGFEEVGNTLIKINADEKPPFKSYLQKDTPFYIDKSTGEMGSFGAGIYVNTKESGAKNPDGFVYVYGVRGRSKKLLVARVKPIDFEDFDKWKFWDGKSWQSDILNSAAITDQVSNELSVTALPDGRYALVFQHGGMGKSVAMRLGETPFGPFGNVIPIWDCSDDLKGKSFFAYNAKAHPSLSEEGELLVSYNINSLEFLQDLGKDPQFYRPRFIKVKFE
ncbi:DUF4185 domain-containing protein [Sphingobacterium hungaricum]|uniref:DUF4185 domain-containing protein n=1 Tax=Sphingobacterium hungaricum TaxID=2082723 RepID=A0A928YQ65_9SPHI|nr:DUF4185 domain-containing protein [Sphingobacterium hungaricum]MBE8713876.1 hypothetical protein [Sphingobacterium hungaricum]